MIDFLPLLEKSHQPFKLPAFFPDATQAVVRSLDSEDVFQTGIRGVLINTYHLYRHFGKNLKPFENARQLMNWPGALISDSGGFQIMSLIHKTDRGKITDQGALFKTDVGNTITFTPELSIKLQFNFGADVLVVLDDFTPLDATKKQAAQTVDRTVNWAKRAKLEFDHQCQKRKLKQKPTLIGVVQGGKYQDLREECAQALVKIGFDGLGFGGWPVDSYGQFDYKSAQTIASNTPDYYYLYGLGIGKPEDIVGCVKLGYNLFDCVLPTRDARHKRLYVFTGKKPNSSKRFYSTLDLGKKKFLEKAEPADKNCRCRFCQNYSLAYLAHLFRIGDPLAFRLATIHNLSFYTRLMEKRDEPTTVQSF